jgi:beta-galactosidase
MMPHLCRLFLASTVSLGTVAFSSAVAQQHDAILPAGVEAVWDLEKALHEATPTRERICLNGLWQWQPGEAQSAPTPPPADGWGYFKVPGCWPGITDYMQKDCQTVFAHPSWNGRDLRNITAAWYRRDFRVPADWSDRRMALRVEYINSYAAVYVDGKRAGEIHFPGGELDLTKVCRPGDTHSLELLVVAMPLKGVMLSYGDSEAAREVKGSVQRRGLCGDVYLTGTPLGPRLTDIRTETSVRHQQFTLDAAFEGLTPGESYHLSASVSQDGHNLKTMTSPAFKERDLKGGRMTSNWKWMPDRLWDTDTPQNLCTLELSLLDSNDKVLDAALSVRFGFREFWIEGRDFYLNGKRIFLSCVPLDNAEISAALSTYGAARESFERLKGFGINFVYTHNYGCDPGSHLGFEEILRAADDSGMLMSFSQPHFSHYEWKGSKADQNNGYALHAEYYVRSAQNHPSVVMYAMSHNAAGYDEDMNPDMIDGVHDAREKWAQRNSEMALRAEAIVRRLDPSRVVYHHASGNLGSMHTINFYPNFAPAQELSDWFEHWANQGVKPVFTCEYGAPFTWDWTMYRGFYKGEREFGSAAVPWEFCVAEWNAQFFGDSAYQISEPEKENLRWEAKQFEAGRGWHRWDYPNEVSSTRFEENYPVFALYLTDNWRAFRTWGVSAISAWEFGHFWKLRDGVDKSRRALKVDWQNLQRPGFSPDFIGPTYERMDIAFERSDWIETPAAQALMRNNRPLLAWLAGKASAFTSKDHNFLPGETVEKQLILVNNSRQSVQCDCQWSLASASPSIGGKPVTVEAGQQERITLKFELPAALASGGHELNATVKFSDGQIQNDSLRIDVMPQPSGPLISERIALFDPKGETGALLTKLGVHSESVKVDADLSAYDILIVGKSALTLGGSAPDISRVREGLKVLIFEQTSEVLEKRFGFRVEEYGLRRVFPRVADHPALAGIDASNLCDWRGEATITAPRLTYETRPQYGPTVQWAGIPVARLWRCGNRGNVASVLIEKPACGDFLPLLDGGFDLQFSPLMEYHEGKGLVLFCQMDATGRTEAEPAAESLTRNLIQYVSAWKPSPRRDLLYAGSRDGLAHLGSLGFRIKSYDGGNLYPEQVLVLGPGAGTTLAGHKQTLADWLKAGGDLLAIGLSREDANAVLPFPVEMKQAEHISTFFSPFSQDNLMAGIGPADVHIRAPRQLPLVSAGAEIVGDGVLAKAEGGGEHVVFCQLEPWSFDTNQANQKRSFRRTSFLVSRLLANMGVAGSTPLLDRFHRPGDASEKRWLTGFYLDQPEAWDDPYRHFRW